MTDQGIPAGAGVSGAAPLPARFRAPSPLMELLREALRRWRTRVGLALVGLVTLVALGGPFVAPHSSRAFLAAPFSIESGVFGTDVYGRDVWSRFLSGGRSTLALAVAATMLGVGLGTALGLAAAISRSWRGELLMRGLDVILAFPQYVLVLVVAAMVGPSSWLTVMLIAVAHTPGVARVMRAAALEVTERDFVSYSRSLGASRGRILLSDVLRNVTGPLTVEVGLRLTYSVAIVAGLSFLGFGPQPPAPDWGVMISENRSGLTVQPWGALLPVLAIGVLTVGSNLVAEGVARASAGLDRRVE